MSKIRPAAQADGKHVQNASGKLGENRQDQSNPTSIPDHSRAMRPRCEVDRFYYVAALGFLTFLGLAFASRLSSPEARMNSWLSSVGKFIVIDQQLVPADYIFVLNGRIAVRGAYGAHVYNQQFAEHVLIAESAAWGSKPGALPAPVSELIVRKMVGLGVPRAAVQTLAVEGGVRSTRDEARALRNFLSKSPAERVIVVTSDYHTRRARLILRQELRGLDVRIYMASAPDNRGFAPTNWWQSGEGIRQYGSEYIKIVWALLRR